MSDSTKTQQHTLPMLPMREDIIFPGMTVPFFIGRKQSMEAVEEALRGDRRIFVVTQKDTTTEKPEKGDLFAVGTIGNVLQIMRLPNGTLKALYEAKGRGRILETNLSGNYYSAQVEELPYVEDESEEFLAVAEKVKESFPEAVDRAASEPGADLSLG
ncbi:MAG: LON peptidase substrate-binding domain-containing protein [SAR324 cluster bacterium]|nr:LON peptidase substrate-binding domain-containing protein [SAR324 cluster bacterium]